MGEEPQTPGCAADSLDSPSHACAGSERVTSEPWLCQYMEVGSG